MTPLPVLSCDGCGACCLQAGSPPFARGEPVPADLPAEARAAMRATAEAVCSWFDREARRCRWYDWRPRECRELAVGGAGCLAARGTCPADS